MTAGEVRRVERVAILASKLLVTSESLRACEKAMSRSRIPTLHRRKTEGTKSAPGPPQQRTTPALTATPPRESPAGHFPPRSQRGCLSGRCNATGCQSTCEGARACSTLDVCSASGPKACAPAHCVLVRAPRRLGSMEATQDAARVVTHARKEVRKGAGDWGSR